MPEGPSLYIWSTMTKQFLGRKITRICGSSKTVDKMKWSGATLVEVRVYGKRLFLHLAHSGGSTSSASDEESVWIRCHFLMWGSVRVNEFNCKPSKTNRFPEPRLVLYFSKDEFLVFYGGSFKEMDQPPEDESSSDILSDAFDRSRAVDHLLEDHPISFTLLDQRKFTGLGNIIKNEVLFSTGTHPMQIGSHLSRAQATTIADTVVTFSKRWLAWKMEEKPLIKFGDWTEIYKKAMCPSDHKTARSMFGPTGMERITYWCPTCQPINTLEHDLPSEKRDMIHTSNKGPEAADESSMKRLSQTIPDSEHWMTTEDETSMTNSPAGDQVMPLRTVPNVENFKQEETPVHSSQELQLVDSPGMEESHSSADDPRGPKSEQTSVDPPHHQVEMNGTSLSIPSLQTEPSYFVKSLSGNENSSPLSMEQPRHCCHTTPKIKLESEETSDCGQSGEACENVSHHLLTTTSLSDVPSCNVQRIGVQDQQHRGEDLTRVSVSISTIKVLMRSHVRVNAKKLKSGED